ncbi:MFS transporter [Amycolatopsis sp. YIM 10]|uniref:MFS transporter n=1 Tax=Amycolatopsis sp. YIM 10 TaxID=2653857 RepID=UPI0012A85CEB|nr:MFS transporter [Amycolatopsis sp. YIM 10]QFU86943.1 putative sulfoacetate transporter SauU [Amycolatopsis sp. YIM 10]
MREDVRAPKQPLDRTARVTVLLLFAAWTVDYVDRLLVNLALPQIGADFGLDHTEQGLVLSAFFLAYALFQIPGGLLADRFGAVRVMLVAVLAWSAFTALTGLAGLVGSFALLLVVRFLFGAAQGVFPGASIKALSERTEPGQRMTANGWMQSSNAFGVLLAPAIAAPLIAWWGWRGAFAAIAVLGVFVFMALRKWLPAPRTTADRQPGGGRAVLLSPVMWRFALMFFGYDVIVWGLASWVPSYLQSERGLTLTEAGAITALPAIFGGVAVVLGGRWSDRLGGRHRVVVLPAMAATAACLVVMSHSEPTALFAVFLTLTGFFAALCYMPVFAVPLRSLPAELAGAGAGLIVFGGQSAGMVVPVVMGALVDGFSYRVAFLALLSGVVLTVLAALATPQTTEQFKLR